MLVAVVIDWLAIGSTTDELFVRCEAQLRAHCRKRLPQSKRSSAISNVTLISFLPRFALKVSNQRGNILNLHFGCVACFWFSDPSGDKPWHVSKEFVWYAIYVSSSAEHTTGKLVVYPIGFTRLQKVHWEQSKSYFASKGL